VTSFVVTVIGAAVAAVGAGDTTSAARTRRAGCRPTSPAVSGVAGPTCTFTVAPSGRVLPGVAATRTAGPDAGSIQVSGSAATWRRPAVCESA
jgi:hypothetical protein